MRFEKDELKEVIELLEKSNNPNARKMAIGLKEMVDDPECYDCNLINRNHYLATVLWRVEDVKKALKNNGFAGTEENVDTVCRDGLIKSLEDCSEGWDVIDFAICSLGDYLEREE